MVHGSAEATEHLKQHFLNIKNVQVYAPQIEETIDVTSDLCAYKVRMQENFDSYKNIYYQWPAFIFLLPSIVTYRCNFQRSWWVMCFLKRYHLSTPTFMMFNSIYLSACTTNCDWHNLQFQLGDYEVAWVDAEVGKTENGMLSLLPISSPAPPHKSVLVGDLKMADFKQFLASKGVQVFFLFSILQENLARNTSMSTYIKRLMIDNLYR